MLPRRGRQRRLPSLGKYYFKKDDRLIYFDDIVAFIPNDKRDLEKMENFSLKEYVSKRKIK
jgi:hypothetical protein